jgi:hypothetical protein
MAQHRRHGRHRTPLQLHPAHNQLIETINALDDANISGAAAISLSKLAITPMARVFHNANQAVPNAAAAVAFNSERYDTAALHDPANNSRLAAPTAGVWAISFSWDATTNGANYEFFLRVNGTTEIARYADDQVSGTWRDTLSTEYQLAAGDYVEVMMIAQTAGTVTLNAVGNRSPEFTMSLVSRAV